MAPDAAARAKVSMLRAHEDGAARRRAADVPDPYYGGSRGFEDVFDICQAACAGFLARLRREHRL